ncbi:MAG: DUF2076 domain-containing protein [Hyphomicrobium sp.]
MNSDERQLITDLFSRMQSHGLAEKDPQAAALIAERVRAMPDAPYMLVQSVLVQEMALQQADQRIRDLEDQMAELEQQRVPAAGAGGGSFLGGLFGGNPQPAPRPTARGSVPAMGVRPTAGSRPPTSPASAPSPWGNAAGANPGAPPQAAPAAGGGFMRSAMTTAAGVAGGMLLADGIRNMMNGDAAKPAATDTAAADAAADAETDAEVDQADYQDPASNDPGVQDVGGYDDGGGDFGGSDFDV